MIKFLLFELLRKDWDIYYWKDHVGHEVDFVLKKGLHVEQPEDMYEDKNFDGYRIEFRPVWLWLIME